MIYQQPGTPTVPGKSLTEEEHVMKFSKTKRTDKDGREYELYRVTLDGDAVSFRAWMDSLSSADPASRQAFLRALRSSEYEEYFFEMKPIDHATKDEAFEFVLIKTNELAKMKPDPYTFGENLKRAVDHYACVFQNLTRDATLVAPCRPTKGTLAPFSHLAVFCRQVDEALVLATWSLAVDTFVEELDRRRTKMWFSTDGRGVAWLHFRVEPKPKHIKYYK